MLVPIFEEDGEARYLLTRRPSTMPSHREIAFPGGGRHPGDADAAPAARRPRRRSACAADVELVAGSTARRPSSGSSSSRRSSASSTARRAASPPTREVDRVFDVALSELLADGVYHEERWAFFGGPDDPCSSSTRGRDGVGRTARILTVSSPTAPRRLRHRRPAVEARAGRPLHRVSLSFRGGAEAGDSGVREGAEIEIGIGKSGRRAYGFDDIAIVPEPAHRDPEDVDISWEIDALRFDLPMMASAMDGVVSPATAIEVGRLGGRRCLNLEGLWTRYDDPDVILEEIAELSTEKATAGCRRSTRSRSRTSSSGGASRRSRRAASTACASLTPQRVERYATHVLEAELDLLVIQGTVVSAEHVSKTVEPLNLKRFIREFDLPVIVGGCASYSTALHLMRTGAVGVLVGVGPGRRAPAAACSASASRRPPPSPTPPAPASATSTRPASTCTSSPTAACAPAATSPRRSRAAPTP